ncbi:MAG: hypothetical protein CME06_04485 [Gemmatimonadetes bacterium]|nr:hypothetical protein [Gemmatimonadota bacterium]
MANSFRTTALRALILIALGSAIGIGNNLLAGAHRRLDWISDYPALEARNDRTGGSRERAAPSGHALAATQGSGSLPQDLSDISIPEPNPDELAVEIDPLQAARLYSNGAVFVDSRRSREFVEGHIAGARSISYWESAVVAGRIEELAWSAELDDPIVVYCNGGDCPDSHALSELLWGAGFVHVLIYRDGYPDWIARGGATEKGASR